jgi:ATP-dependent DNA ligase
MRLLSRNGYERSRYFGAVFADLARLGRQIVLDGEIAAPDERGVTHLDDIAAAMRRRDRAVLAYFAFDMLYLDGRDLRRCPLIERKAILAELLRYGAEAMPNARRQEHRAKNSRRAIALSAFVAGSRLLFCRGSRRPPECSGVGRGDKISHFSAK